MTRRIKDDDNGDMGLDAPVMTRREALEKAHGRLASVVYYCLDLNMEPDKMDKESIRESFAMVQFARRSDLAVKV